MFAIDSVPLDWGEYDLELESRAGNERDQHGLRDGLVREVWVSTNDSTTVAPLFQVENKDVVEEVARRTGSALIFDAAGQEMTIAGDTDEVVANARNMLAILEHHLVSGFEEDDDL